MWGNTRIIKYVLLLAIGSTLASGQQQSAVPIHMAAASGGRADGTLTVTATVVTSVGVILGPGGQQEIVVANAPDSADNVSHFVILKEQEKPAPDKPKKSKKQ